MHLPEAKISAANCVLPELSTEEQHVCGKTCGTNHHLLCYLLHSRDCLCQHAYVFLAVGQLCLCVHWNKILKTKRTDVLKIYCYFSESNKDGVGGGGGGSAWEYVCMHACVCVCACVCVHVCACIWVYEKVQKHYAQSPLCFTIYVYLRSCIMFCYFTGILYAVTRQTAMLLIDNKDSVFCVHMEA